MLSRDDRLSPLKIEEGDRVTMSISAHDYTKSGGMLTGTVTEALSEHEREAMEDGMRPMADMVVEGENTGTIWRWNVDNGYVLGPVDHPNRPSRSDIGRFSGFYDPDAREEFDRQIDAGVNDPPFDP